MLKKAENGTRSQFEGFCVDLLERVAEQVGFRYRMELAPDGIFGHLNPKTGEWDGLVRRLIDKVSGGPGWKCGELMLVVDARDSGSKQMTKSMFFFAKIIK